MSFLESAAGLLTEPVMLVALVVSVLGILLEEWS